MIWNEQREDGIRSHHQLRSVLRPIRRLLVTSRINEGAQNTYHASEAKAKQAAEETK